VAVPPGPGGPGYADFGGVSCRGSSCILVGAGASPSGGGQSVAELLRGAAWTLSPQPPGPGWRSVSCVSPVSCEAVGSGGAARWDGAHWRAQPVPGPAGSQGAPTSVWCTSAGSCQAVGTYGQFPVRSFAVGWNGRRWSLEPVPAGTTTEDSSLIDVSCSAPNACTAVGATSTTLGGDFGRTSQPLADRWDGSRWSVESVPQPPAGHGELASVSCSSPALCLAVGSSMASGGYPVLPVATLAELWNGSAWRVVPSPNPKPHSGFSGLSCVGAGPCVAVGVAGGAPLAERWGGSGWTVETVAGPAKGHLVGVSCSSANFCEAVGNGSSSGAFAEGYR
jgi:hypothetical protein